MNLLEMQEQFKQIQEDAVQQIQEASNLADLDQVRVQYLGKKGPITEVLRNMKALDPADRPKVGALANEIREVLENELLNKKAHLEQLELEATLTKETIDVTLPGADIQRGTTHVLSLVSDQVEDFFIGLGYQVVEGPEVESDHYNFEMMNLPKDHPARPAAYADEHDDVTNNQQKAADRIAQLKSDLQGIDATLAQVYIDLDSLNQKIPAAETELTAAENKRDAAQREHGVAVEQLKASKAEQTRLSEDIVEAENQQKEAEGAIAGLAREMYRSGRPSPLVIAMTAEGSQEISDRAAVAETMARSQDAVLGNALNVP